MRVLFIVWLVVKGATVGYGNDVAKVEFFEKKVRPVLVANCHTCHAAETKPSGGLRVDDWHGLLEGGKSGPAVVPGDPAASLLLQRVQHPDPKKVMPQEGERLTAEQVADLRQWIEDGAAWPRERIPASLTKANPEFDRLKKTHWAWQPLSKPAPPPTKDSAWAIDDVDRFILVRLEGEGLAPVADADRSTWLRRVTFDLTGLPPTSAEVERFENDPSPEAFAKVVDRLLDSSAFGQHWGRHWLDVARYGESTGPSRNIPYPHAWRYRDYVIDAVSHDVPFDQFLVEQIAGDLTPAKDDAERDRLLTATGFLALGVKDVNQRFKVRFLMDNVDEQVDVVTRSVLGLTVSCARCHDHKFDPVTMRDYYALAGIFTSTENAAGVRNKMGGGGLDYYDPAALVRLSSELPAPPVEKVRVVEAELAEAKAAWEKIRGTPEGLKPAADGKPTQRSFRLRFEKLQSDLLELTDPAARGHVVHGVREGRVADTEVRIRGEAERLGPTIPRGFLTTFHVPGTSGVSGSQSGRLELARWLTSPENPLTARVMVNRVWHHLFGCGLVSTVDNFGVTGDTPSHPELLDYLAGQFMSDGWSVKRLIRRLALSRAYRLGGGGTVAQRELERDPANRLLWRHSPRRLTAEEMRDSMLLSSGRLLLAEPPAAASTLRMVELRDNGPEAARLHVAADESLHRSVYLPVLRGLVPKAIEAFDPVEQTLVTGARAATTVPTQSLYLMNSGFVGRQSLALAERLLRLPAEERLRQAWLLTLGREPRPGEVIKAARFVTAMAESWIPNAEAQPPTAPPPAVAEASSDGSKPPAVSQANSDDIDRTDVTSPDAGARPTNARTEAWMRLAQSLYASAEFRFVR